jgi:Ca2+:H+ antiporter
LVLGTAICAGGSRTKTLTFNRSAAQASSSTLLLAVSAMTIPAIFFQTLPLTERPVTTESLSICVSVFMLMSYFASLWFALRTHTHFCPAGIEPCESKRSPGTAIIILLLASVAVGSISNILVQSIGPVALALT